MTSPVLTAFRDKHYDLLQSLIDSGADPNKNNPLAYAALDNDLTAARILLSSPTINVDKFCGRNHAVDLRYRTPLYIAIVQNYFDMVELLLSKNATLHRGCFRAVFVNDTRRVDQNHTKRRLVELLLHHGADINDIGPRWTCLKLPQLQDTPDVTAIMCAAESTLDAAFWATYLVEKGANVRQTDQTNRNALFYALEFRTPSKNVVAWVKFLLEQGIDANCIEKGQQKTPIFHAHHIQLAKLLLENGATLNHKDRFGTNAMEFGLQTQNAIEWLDLFLLKKPLPNFVSLGCGRFFRNPNYRQCVDKVLAMIEPGMRQNAKILNDLFVKMKERDFFNTSETSHYANGVDYIMRKFYFFDVTEEMVINAITCGFARAAKVFIRKMAPIDFSKYDHLLRRVLRRVHEEGYGTINVELRDLLSSLGVSVNDYENPEMEPLMGLMLISEYTQNGVDLEFTNTEPMLFLARNGCHDLNRCLAQNHLLIQSHDMMDEEDEEEEIEFDRVRIPEVLYEYKSDLTQRLQDPSNQNVNELAPNGYSLLHYAVLQGSLEDVISLVRRGARISLKSRGGKTSLDLAKTYRRQDMVDYFEQVQVYNMIIDKNRTRDEIIRQDTNLGLRPLRGRDYDIQTRPTTLLNLDPSLMEQIKEFVIGLKM